MTIVRAFVTDCAFGTFISAVIIFICLLIMSLVDFVNNLQIIQRGDDPPVENNELNEENIDFVDLPPLIPQHQEEEGEQEQEQEGEEEEEALETRMTEFKMKLSKEKHLYKMYRVLVRTNWPMTKI